LKVSVLAPSVQARVRFSLRDRKQVPPSSGCYALTSLEGDVLYVGLATNLSSRLCQHREDDSKRNPIRGVSAVWFYFTQVSRFNLRRVERGWMNQYMDQHAELPPLNKVYSPIS
jgi:hypothetical protein